MKAPKRDYNPRNRIFIGNINNKTTIQDIKKHFQKFGNVTEIYVKEPFAFAVI